MGLPSDLIADAEGVADQDVYPDVWPALDMLIDMQTQWRVGAAGATGMDYTALETLMRVKRVKTGNGRTCSEMCDGWNRRCWNCGGSKGVNDGSETQHRNRD